MVLPETTTDHPIPLPTAYNQYLENCNRPILDKLQPIIQDVAVLHTWAMNTLKVKFDMPRASDFEIESAIIKLTSRPLTLEEEGDYKLISRREVAAEFLHMKKVLGTTLALKRFMYENNLPERVFAYQTGTGFPIPEEMEGCRRLNLYLPYGEKILQHLPKPSVQGHDDSSGMYFYEITAENGQKSTLIVLNKRKHAYELLGTPRPHHALALIWRVLKGIGTESLLTTFATGFDGVPYGDEEPPNVGDFGFMIGNQDLTGVLAQTHPGIGSQTLLHQFGGPFQPGVTRTSPKELIGLFQEEFTRKREELEKERGDIETYDENTMFYNDTPLPRTHPVIEYDCAGVVDFENAPDWAAGRDRTGKLSEQPGMVDSEIVSTTDGNQVISAHGMAVAAEAAAQAQENPGGIKTLFNRLLQTLYVAGATDLVDPRTGGQSHRISHQEVQKAGERSAAFIAPVISRYFIRLAGR